jgi:hypothetical protein
MNADALLIRQLPLHLFHEGAPIEDWLATPFASMSDAQLASTCIEAISTPKTGDKRNSFLLHAPLELLARLALLPGVERAHCDEARRRIAEIAVRYANDGEELDVAPRDFESVGAARASLLEAMVSGGRAEADAALCYLLQHESLPRIARELFDPIATSYGAAGHAPILLAELQRVAGRYVGVGQLLRAPLRYLVSQSNVALPWVDRHSAHRVEGAANEPASLWQAFAQPESISVPDHSIATELLAPEKLGRYERDLGAFSFADTDAIERVLLRAAAHSMLQDDAKQAPYGWTHCMTLPLALMTNTLHSRNPQRVTAMAAAEVYAFRATMGKTRLSDTWKPEPPKHRELIAATPNEAASIAFHASREERWALLSKLTMFAATHRDAHLAKYTLACFDAAARDPDCESLYFAAAAYLGAWWREFDAIRG